MNKGFTVIIVTHNSNDYLPICLTSIDESAKGFNFQVIVVDNDSTQPPRNLFEEDFAYVEWIESKENLGFGKACNLGVTHSVYNNLFFINPDTLLSESTFSEMLNFIENNEGLGIVGCKILNGDGTLQAACRRNFPSPSGAIYHTLGLDTLFPQNKVFGQYNLTYLSEDETHELDAISGSFFWIHKDIYQKINGFDEAFFLYGEDLDLCYRVKKLGLKNVYFPGVKVMHFKGHSSNQKPWRTSFHFYNAMRIFARKNRTNIRLPLGLIEVGILLSAGVGFTVRFINSSKKIAVEASLLGMAWGGGLWAGWWNPVNAGYWLFPVLGITILGAILAGRTRKSSLWDKEPHFTKVEMGGMLLSMGIAYGGSGMGSSLFPIGSYFVLKLFYCSLVKQMRFFAQRSWRLVGLDRLTLEEEENLKKRSFVDWCGWLKWRDLPSSKDAFCLGNVEDLHQITRNLGITHLVMQPRTFKPAQKVLFCGESNTKSFISKILFPSLRGKNFIEINLKNLQ